MNSYFFSVISNDNKFNMYIAKKEIRNNEGISVSYICDLDEYTKQNIIDSIYLIIDEISNIKEN